MRRFNELDKKELVNLTEKEIQRLIDLECAESGVPLPVACPDPPVKPVVTPTVEVFEVHVSTLRFKSREAAEHWVDELNQLDLLETYYLKGGYSYSGPQGIKPKDEVNFKMDKVTYWKPEEYELNKHVLEAYEENKKRWEKQKKEYDSTSSGRSECAETVREAVNEAYREHNTAEQIRNVYEQYLELAKNDHIIALDFLFKTKQWDEETVNAALQEEPTHAQGKSSDQEDS